MLTFFARSSDVIGIIGVILLLIAYFLLNTHKLAPMSLFYQLFNFFGAFFIFYSLLFNWNLSAALIEIAWMIISMIGVYQIWRRKKIVS